MKKIITYFAAVILGTTILAVSPGVSIYRMQCLSGNFSSTSFYAPIDCRSEALNKEKGEHETLSSRCCDFSYNHVQLKVLSYFSLVKSPIPFVFGLPAAFMEQYRIGAVASTATEFFRDISSSPPWCPDILSLIRILLI